MATIEKTTENRELRLYGYCYDPEYGYLTMSFEMELKDGKHEKIKVKLEGEEARHFVEYIVKYSQKPKKG